MSQPPFRPSLPHPRPGLSLWHRTTRAFPYLNSNSTATVPSFSKYVIIGSGIAGALTAYSLIKEEGVPASTILILEAREAVSGASGRNAGHVRPDAFRGFSMYAAVHSAEQARKIIENEKLVLERVAAFVKDHDVACDFNYTSTFDVCLTPEFAALEAKSFEEYEKAGGDLSHVCLFKGEEAESKTGVQNTVAAYEWPAASIHPAKLAQWLLASVIEEGARLWTHCPVTSITPSSTSGWDIHTPRGFILADQVVHCTNAYASYLLPQLQGFITPNKAQAHSIVPNAAWTKANSLHNTISLRYSLHHFYSLIQRQGDGTLVLGTSRTNPNLSQRTRDGMVGFDDSGYQEEIANDALQTFNTLFPGYTKMGENGLDLAWTGIIARSSDMVPWIGKLDGLEGQWVCAGFNGHGESPLTNSPSLPTIAPYSNRPKGWRGSSRVPLASPS